MTTDLILPLIPILLLLMIFWLKRLIQRFLFATVLLLGGSQRLALTLYSLIFVTGVLIHELAHFFMAALLGVRSGSITFFPDIWGASSGRVRLGSVQVEKTDFIRMSLVGAAPMIIGLTIISALSIVFFDRLGIPILDSLPQFFSALSDSFDWVQLVLLYLIISVSNTLFVSKEDTRAWPALIVFFSLLIIFMVVVGVAGPFFTGIWNMISGRMKQISTILVFVAVVDACLALCLGLFVKVIGKMLKRRIVYSGV